MIAQAIAEFGQRLGLGNLALTPPKPLTLTLEGLGLLTLEFDADPPTELLMTLAAKLAPYDRRTMKLALELCSFDHNRPFSLACGCQADHLLFMTRLPVDGRRGDDLEKAAEMLVDNMRPLSQEGAR